MTNDKLRPGVVLTEIHGVCFLTADRAARKRCPYIRRVNEIGAFLWKQLEDGADDEAILSHLRSEYEVPENYDLRKDVDAFLQMLKDGHYLLDEAEHDDL